MSANPVQGPVVTPLRKPAAASLVPRFSLRTLLLATAVCGVVFAVVSQLDGRIATLVLFTGLLIGTHVLGNSLGTRLRDAATRDFPPTLGFSNANDAAQAGAFAPPRLALGNRLPRLVFPVTIAGAFIGALLGGAGFSMTYPDVSGAAIGLGVVSSAVLGGFGGFGASSFFLVLRQALNEAWGSRDPALEKRDPAHSNS